MCVHVYFQVVQWAGGCVSAFMAVAKVHTCGWLLGPGVFRCGWDEDLLPNCTTLVVVIQWARFLCIILICPSLTLLSPALQFAPFSQITDLLSLATEPAHSPTVSPASTYLPTNHASLHSPLPPEPGNSPPAQTLTSSPQYPPISPFTSTMLPFAPA